MFNAIITLAIVLMVLYMVISETQVMFAKPTGCKKTVMPKTIAQAKKALNSAVSKVKAETAHIQKLIQNKASPPKPTVISNPVEHVQASPNIVIGSNAIQDTIDDDLPFADYAGNPVVKKATLGLIEGVRPPTYADPRVMNPSLAAAPVQFSDPSTFGSFGVTENLAFVDNEDTTNAEITSEHTLEGFESNGAVLVMDGKIVKSPCELPSYQLKGIQPHTTLPLRNLNNPPPMIEDLVENDMFDGLQGYPIDEKLDLLTPPGIATPGSEFASIMYGYPQ